MVYNNDSISRRNFLQYLAAGSISSILYPIVSSGFPRGNQVASNIYISKNGSPSTNLDQVLNMMGGISQFVGRNDIVIIKPNCQWWNQGTTNIEAVRRLIEIIFDIDDFEGEIILAENIHRNTYNSRGWTVDNEINYDTEKNIKNYNELLEYFNSKGYANLTKYHLKSSDKYQGTVVTGPEDGDGYVHTDIEYTFDGRKTIMTYPVFTSSYSGITIDFKNGAWKNGNYIDRKVTFINTAVLNDHGSVNATCSLKNLMGIVDLPGNETGMIPETDYYNFHSILTRGMGGALGMFINTIRKPDLNIITAEWVGWGSRVEADKAAHAKTILASTDPVALDYWATKYILYPVTPDDDDEKLYHNPDNDFTHLWKYLTKCTEEGVGTMDESEMVVTEYDFNTALEDSAYRYRSADIKITSNYPNPFNSLTKIRFELNRPMSVKVRIYNSLGRKIKDLVSERNFNSGIHNINWDGSDNRSRQVAGGVYICEITVERKRFYLKMALLN